MGVEIERKFLVDFDKINKNNFKSSEYIEQGYILNSPDKVVRVRIGNKCYLTVKGKNIGASRPEFEYEIPLKEARFMLREMCDKVIKKTRNKYLICNDVWEIDEFHGNNEGLILAECEIPSEDYNLFIPKWVIKEVTGDSKYYNNNLIKNEENK